MSGSSSQSKEIKSLNDTQLKLHAEIMNSVELIKKDISVLKLELQELGKRVGQVEERDLENVLFTLILGT